MKGVAGKRGLTKQNKWTSAYGEEFEGFCRK